MIAREGLGIADQLPSLSTQFVHQTDKCHVSLGVAARYQLLVIKPKLFDLPSPGLASRYKTQLRVLPFGHKLPDALEDFNHLLARHTGNGQLKQNQVTQMLQGKGRGGQQLRRWTTLPI